MGHSPRFAAHRPCAAPALPPLSAAVIARLDSS